MMQARYQPGNVGHFGLALGAYAHFTSPIRRYPDLLVHRAIKWLNDKRSAKGFRYALAGDGAARRALLAHGAPRRRSDARGRRAVEVRLSRRSASAKPSTSSSAASSPFGLFVRLAEIQADGLVHVTALPRDYYHRDPTGTTLKGERSGREYRLTESIKVRLAGVNVEERKIDFVPVENDGQAAAAASWAARPWLAAAKHLYGLHAVRAVLERRPETVLAAKILRDASGKLAELERALAARGIALAARRARRSRSAHARAACTKASSWRLPPRRSSRSAISRRSSSSAAARCGCSCSTASRTRAISARACARPTRPASMPSSCPKDHSAKLTAAAVKTSTGAAETVPVFRAPNLARALAWLKEAGVWVVGADAEAPRSLYETKLAPPVALVLGGEGRGVRRLTRDLCDELVYHPDGGLGREPERLGCHGNRAVRAAAAGPEIGSAGLSGPGRPGRMAAPRNRTIGDSLPHRVDGRLFNP